MLNAAQRDKSVSNDVHYAALVRIRSIIKESEIVDNHPDFRKDVSGKRTPQAGVNPDVTIDVLYGAVRFDGEVYRVKTTVKRYVDKNKKSKAYAYSVENIEVLPGTLASGNNASIPHGSTSITGDILLRGVRKVNQKTGGDGEFPKRPSVFGR